jgi:hypothetical protein
MRRAELEHVIAAAAQITREEEFVVVGSQAILGSHPDAPVALLRSIEADIYPAHAPRTADERRSHPRWLRRSRRPWPVDQRQQAYIRGMIEGIVKKLDRGA